uniref:Uncharacterized protein LOC114342322 n=1 Tax=Diabrotica virgifera virgifera TaxID=50390 RepID=A0A6P7GS84_DIAVI
MLHRPLYEVRQCITDGYHTRQAVALLREVLSQRVVANRLKSQSPVSRVYRRYQDTGYYVRRQEGGQKRITREINGLFLISKSLKNRHLTGANLKEELREVRGVITSVWIVRKRLKAANLTPKRVAMGPKLTAPQKHRRLEFARDEKGSYGSKANCTPEA